MRRSSPGLQGRIGFLFTLCSALLLWTQALKIGGLDCMEVEVSIGGQAKGGMPLVLRDSVSNSFPSVLGLWYNPAAKDWFLRKRL